MKDKIIYWIKILTSASITTVIGGSLILFGCWVKKLTYVSDFQSSKIEQTEIQKPVCVKCKTELVLRKNAATVDGQGFDLMLCPTCNILLPSEELEGYMKVRQQVVSNLIKVAEIEKAKQAEKKVGWFKRWFRKERW